MLLQGMMNIYGFHRGSDLRSQVKGFPDEKLALARRQVNLLVHSLFGTLEPVVPIKLIPQAFSLSGGLVIPTYAIEYSAVHDNAAWSTLFDEYKLMHGWVRYEPQWQQSYGSAAGGPLYLGIGVIDYDDSTALTTMASANGYDTAKWFPLSPIEYHTETWEFFSQGQPDLEWTDSSTNKQIGWWKGLSDQSPFPYTSAYGRVHGKIYVQFRQLA